MLHRYSFVICRAPENPCTSPLEGAPIFVPYRVKVKTTLLHESRAKSRRLYVAATHGFNQSWILRAAATTCIG